jgi:hypothetical protein
MGIPFLLSAKSSFTQRHGESFSCTPAAHHPDIAFHWLHTPLSSSLPHLWQVYNGIGEQTFSSELASAPQTKQATAGLLVKCSISFFIPLPFNTHK